MKAMVLYETAPIRDFPLKYEEAPLPLLRPGQVLIKVSVCGVCHTDLHTVEGDVPPHRLPIIPGHQVVGTIERLSDDVAVSEAIRPGARVGVPWLHETCGTCSYCAQGLENLCDEARFTGLDANGGYAEYMVAPAEFVVPIPDAFSDIEAAPLLCAGIIGYRSLCLTGLCPGERIGLFGFGASAHLALQVARHWGSEVFVFTRSPEHQELARSLGASWVGTSTQTPPGLLDRAITFAPAGDLVPRALEYLKKGGTLAINAIHMDRLPEMPYDLLYWEKTIRSVANSTRQDAIQFMDVAASIPIRVETQVFPLHDANEALVALKERRIQGSAVLQISAGRA